jgi:hypothetical protein
VPNGHQDLALLVSLICISFHWPSFNKSCITVFVAMRAVQGKMFTQSEIVVNWLRNFAASFDSQPDKAEVHLPYGYKRQVWNIYLNECKTNPNLVRVPENKFGFFWNQHCPHIKCRAYHRL